jgi:hypothetical protein
VWFTLSAAIPFIANAPLSTGELGLAVGWLHFKREGVAQDAEVFPSGSFSTITVTGEGFFSFGGKF